LIEFFTAHGPLLAYVILFLGSLVEGESIVLTASFLAYTGFLSLPKVMTIAFIATLCADQLLFYVGRFYGPGLLERYPKLKMKSKRVFELLHKYNTPFILGFRFVYGIRTVSPLIIGTAGISIQRFTKLNLLAAVIWTVVSCLGGYFLGYLFADVIEDAIHNVGHYQKIVFLSLGGIVLFVIGVFYLCKKWRKKPKSKQEHTMH